MVYSGLQWFTVVYSGFQWFTVVYSKVECYATTQVQCAINKPPVVYICQRLLPNKRLAKLCTSGVFLISRYT